MPQWTLCAFFCLAHAVTIFEDRFDAKLDTWKWQTKSKTNAQITNNGLVLDKGTVLCTCDSFAFQYGQLDIFMVLDTTTVASIRLQKGDGYKLILLQREDVGRPTFVSSMTAPGVKGALIQKEINLWPSGFARFGLYWDAHEFYTYVGSVNNRVLHVNMSDYPEFRQPMSIYLSTALEPGTLSFTSHQPVQPHWLTVKNISVQNVPSTNILNRMIGTQQIAKAAEQQSLQFNEFQRVYQDDQNRIYWFMICVTGFVLVSICLFLIITFVFRPGRDRLKRESKHSSSSKAHKSKRSSSSSSKNSSSSSTSRVRWPISHA